MKRLICIGLGLMLLLGCLPAFAEDMPAPILDLTTVEEMLSQQEAQTAEGENFLPDVNWDVLPEPERPAFVPLLLNIAREELGYVEGSNNFSKYGEWAGDPNAAWCAEFVCWCVNQADLHHDQNLLNQI